MIMKLIYTIEKTHMTWFYSFKSIEIILLYSIITYMICCSLCNLELHFEFVLKKYLSWLKKKLYLNYT